MSSCFCNLSRIWTTAAINLVTLLSSLLKCPDQVLKRQTSKFSICKESEWALWVKASQSQGLSTPHRHPLWWCAVCLSPDTLHDDLRLPQSSGSQHLSLPLFPCQTLYISNTSEIQNACCGVCKLKVVVSWPTTIMPELYVILQVAGWVDISNILNLSNKYGSPIPARRVCTHPLCIAQTPHSATHIKLFLSPWRTCIIYKSDYVQ